MGWFGTGALDGDDGMDLKDELFGFIDIKYNEDYVIIESVESIKNKLSVNQDKIYDWLRDYNWDTHSNPGFIQEVYIQALAQIFLDYGVKISERGKSVMLDFIKNDHWAKSDKKRKKSMDILYEQVRNN